jgi:hypothetical protein
MAGILICRHISPHSLGHGEITNALDAGVPLRDTRSSPGTPTPDHRALRPRAGNLDRHGVHFLTAYVAGV